jgi:hypothetical protein
MRNRILVLLLLLVALLVPAHVGAQTRVLIGAAGGDSFDNYSFGVNAALEIPFAKHFELDLQDTFSPIEAHVALGSGRANAASVGGIAWFSKSFGINGQVQDSSYDVTKVSKDANYAGGGFIYRGIVGGAPTRFNLGYTRQIFNGISSSGLETSRLQGVDFGFTMRFGCVGAFCVRNSADFVFGAVKGQGNPVCDGTFGNTGGNGPNGTCPRSTLFGGGVSASIALEFPRRKGHENDVF